MTDNELTKTIRSVAERVAKGGIGSISTDVQELRDAGIVANMNMGDAAKASPRATMEWYAGQLLDMVENGGWFGINSWLNAVDRFAPEV